jgi:hypothetical protein
MSVRIDSIESTVELERGPAPGQGAAAAAPAWQVLDRLRQLREREERDRVRTTSWDHDD